MARTWSYDSFIDMLVCKNVENEKSFAENFLNEVYNTRSICVPIRLVFDIIHIPRLLNRITHAPISYLRCLALSCQQNTPSLIITSPFDVFYTNTAETNI